MRPFPLTLVTFVVLALIVPAGAAGRSSIRVGLGDQNPAVFDDPNFQRAKIERTRYFVPENVMDDDDVRAKARAFVQAAKAHDVSVLLHISTADLRDKQVVLYCRSGRRTLLAEETLRKAGFTKLMHLEGDYLAWEAAQRPVERTPAE